MLGVGLFLACYFPQRQAKAAFFDRCMELAGQYSAAPFVLAGDLNTGNQRADRCQMAAKFFCSGHFDLLSSVGGLKDLWRLTNGSTREWSWRSNKGKGFRIDHAFGNDSFVAITTPICTYDHGARDIGLTDHSAVVVRLNEVGG